jgi:hypothetical protein
MHWVLTLALVLMGCGRSSPDEVTTIRLESPAVQADGVVSSSHSCGGGTVWFPLKWGPVPPDTEELVLYTGRFSRKGEDRLPKVPYGVLVTRIDPSIHGIATNTLPPGPIPSVYESSNSCPPKKGERTLIRLFALQQPIRHPALNSDSVVELTEAALGIESSAASSEWLEELNEETLASGRLIVTDSDR